MALIPVTVLAAASSPAAEPDPDETRATGPKLVAALAATISPAPITAMPIRRIATPVAIGLGYLTFCNRAWQDRASHAGPPYV